MASMAFLQSLLFQPPPSVFVTVMTAVSTLTMVNAGVNEFRGKHMQYSKLVSSINSGPKLPSKVGMTAFYLPAFVFGATSFFLFPTYQDARFLLIRAALTLHFLKRLLEALEEVVGSTFIQLAVLFFKSIGRILSPSNQNPKAMASMVAMLQSLLFPPPPSVFVTVMTAVSSLTMVNAGVNEFRGKHMQYSKFVPSINPVPKLPSKLGMTALYLPAFVFGAASFFLFPTYQDARFLLIRAALTLHFLKRLLETWFVHKFSGEMTMEAAVSIAFSYFMATLTMIYAQYLSIGLPEPSIDLKYVGLVLFLVGVSGNFYHHYLLSTLRKKGEKEYKIPKGGMFDLVICPHYLFEVLGFWGFAFIAQTVYSLGFTVGTTVYLLGRSHSTRKWYASKFEDFPGHVKAVIPYLF